MDKDIRARVERLKTLLLQDAPIWIEGKDFFAFNYGGKTQGHSMSGVSSKISSGTGSAIIDRTTREWRFGSPHMPIVNVDHVMSFDRTAIDLTFEEVRMAIKGK